MHLPVPAVSRRGLHTIGIEMALAIGTSFEGFDPDTDHLANVR